MAHRFFVPEIPAKSSVLLDGDQAHHAAQVMRFDVGDQIVLFDGGGIEANCEIVSISKKRVELTILDRQEVDRALSTQLTMAVALPKSERQKFLVEKLVELGVDHLIPMPAQRSVANANEKVITRIRKQVVEACKQCERNRLMKISSPLDLKAIKQWASEQPEPVRLWLADPYQGVSIAEANESAQPAELVAIGPEGGFTDQEVAEAVELGFKLLRIGPTILRVETAAIAAAAIFGAGREKF